MSWERISSRKRDGGLGFRNVRDFNVALLGKKAWRLFVYPQKPVSKVFKARYYPTNSFLTGKFGSNPSYIWRSVLEAQNIIKQGVSCRVGNGYNLFIKGFPWLPDANDPYIHSNCEAFEN